LPLATIPQGAAARILSVIRPHSLIAALIAASFAAPALFHAAVATHFAMGGGGALGLDLWNDPGLFMVWLPVYATYGFLFAAAPVTLLTLVMGFLGSHYRWARSLVAWAAAGSLPFFLLSGLTLLWDALALAIPVTCIGTALVARFFIRWTDAPAIQS
jgi:hypothetical protein